MTEPKPVRQDTYAPSGTSFGCDTYGIRPDMMCISKGLTSGYFPLAGSIVNQKVWAVLEEGSRNFGPFAHGFTYAAHPLGAVTALANLDILERENLFENARVCGAYLLERLRQTFAGHDLVGDLRGAGLLAAIEFVADRETRRAFDPALQVGPRVAAACRDEGLIVRPLPHGDIIGFSPPLIISREQIDEVVARCARAVAKVSDQVIGGG